MNAINDLKKKAIDARKLIVQMTTSVQGGHLTGSLSSIDILVALYFNVMRHDPENCLMETRDRFILSKGHGAPALYSVMAMAGYFPIAELFTLRQINSRLQGHPDSTLLPGIEICTGSLGTGFSAAVGMALGIKLGKGDQRVFSLLGDGENDEGQIWEAAMAASHFGLDNIVAIIDRNHYQIDGSTEEIMGLEPLGDKWKSFGWYVLEIDGHDMGEILAAFTLSRGRRTLIIANTIKGKGVSLVENNNAYHSKPLSVPDSILAIAELDSSYKEVS